MTPSEPSSSPAPRVVGLIPARLAATRLPDKPLIDIAGKPMIQHVWERAGRAQLLKEVAVATPDAEIDIGEGDHRRIGRGEDQREPADLDCRLIGHPRLVRHDLEARFSHSAPFGSLLPSSPRKRGSRAVVSLVALDSRLCGNDDVDVQLTGAFARSMMARSSTSQPAASSSCFASSISLWLIPSLQGTKIIPVGATRER